VEVKAVWSSTENQLQDDEESACLAKDRELVALTKQIREMKSVCRKSLSRRNLIETCCRGQ